MSTIMVVILTSKKTIHTTKQLSFNESALETVSFGIFAVFDENTLLHFCVIILNFSNSWNKLPSVSGL